MKLLIKHRFIQILAEIQLTKFLDKIRTKDFSCPHNSFTLGQEEKSQKKIFGEFELDESYFGAKSS